MQERFPCGALDSAYGSQSQMKESSPGKGILFIAGINQWVREKPQPCFQNSS